MRQVSGLVLGDKESTSGFYISHMGNGVSLQYATYERLRYERERERENGWFLGLEGFCLEDSEEDLNRICISFPGVQVCPSWFWSPLIDLNVSHDVAPAGLAVFLGLELKHA